MAPLLQKAIKTVANQNELCTIHSKEAIYCIIFDGGVDYEY